MKRQQEKSAPETKQHDPYIRYAKDIKPRMGFSVLDEAKAMGGPSLLRVFEETTDQKESRFSRDAETILCQGAAVGADREGVVHHFWPREGLRFIGFLQGQGEKELAVKVRGSILLKIKGASEGSRGDSVYCSGPNTFTLEPIGVEIGKIRFFQNGHCAVAFKRDGDRKPLNLRVD